ncbi:polyisoprenoid-binding protein YceI [Pedobacter sp. W3I1]|uniref:YceI family protein n=1 Tax=Pedobacter sp. W3I1 TaxID=3042291 RepID=UPI0027895CD9|nr:YceI family protein [Pedobacter sp. W3I1]MDQ0641014.1 polyisoprenoid-binding protein YceI [Pedobacter sp. W3I1]
MKTFNIFQKKIRPIILLFMLSPLVTVAQTAYQFSKMGSGSVKVTGTSNVHDWSMTSKQFESTGTFNFNAWGEMTDVTALRFTLAARSLKSGKSSMDDRTYKTLSATKFPKISYQLTFATVTMIQAKRYSIETTGILTIAGKTQSLSMKVMALVNADGSISCHGSENLMLTDYGIEPPSFMLGAMKVGNNLNVQFEFDYVKTSVAK